MHSIQLLWLFVAIASGYPQSYGGQYGDLVYEPEGSASDSYPEQYPTASNQDDQYTQPQKESYPTADYSAYSPAPSYGPLKRPYSSRKVSKRPLKIGQAVPARQYSHGAYQNDEKLAYSSPKPSMVEKTYHKEESEYSTPAPSYSTPSPSYSTPAPSYSSPAPSYSSPAPSYSSPAPSYSSPAPSYSSPAPSYSTPAPSYSTPAPFYSTPAPHPKSRPHSRKSSRYSTPKPHKRVYQTDSASYDDVSPQKPYNPHESDYSRKSSRLPEEQSYYDSAESVYTPRKEVYPKHQQKSSYYDDKYNYNRYDEKDPYFNAPATYNYGYEVAEEKTNFNHQENRSGSTTKGEYRVALPDGRVQIVRYIADENGYNAEVSYEGEAHYPEYNDNYLKDSY